MKRIVSTLLVSLLLVCCTVPAFADVLPDSDVLTAYDELLQGTWTLIEKGTRLNKLPMTFTYGEDEGYYLFLAADKKVYLAWKDPEKGIMLTNQFAEVAFSADGQYLLLVCGESASVYVRQ